MPNDLLLLRTADYLLLRTGDRLILRVPAAPPTVITGVGIDAVYKTEMAVDLLYQTGLSYDVRASSE